MADYIDWPSGGATYRYWFLANPSSASGIKAVAGNYMFVRLANDGWVPVYIGIADDLQDRIPSHERWKEAVALGATEVMAHTQANRAKRETEEKALIKHWNPPLNIQHRRRARLLAG
jgi:predicted GIY-YIG superfamily endonuclease